jgi:hypothetical protein
MTNPTSSFGWQMPTNTDLVTDLPADFEVFGQAVDTSMADLLGGTTGQILSKASNTNMDFTWITNDVGDITAVNVTSPITGGGSSGAVTIAIQDALTTQKGAVQLSDSTSTTSSILASTPTATKAAYDLANTANTTANAAVAKSTVTAKGSIFTATASATPAQITVGNNGETLVADSSTSTGLRYQVGNGLAQGAINGGFDIWQRGTSFTSFAGQTFTADRYWAYRGGTSNGTYSRQTSGSQTGFQYFMRVQRTAATTNTDIFYLAQDLETANSIQYAGKAVTLSFYARAGANYSAASSALAVNVTQGTGTDQNSFSGFTGAAGVVDTTVTLTTSWQRFSVTGTVTTASTQLGMQFRFTPTGTAGAADLFDITGIQLEMGSVATNFRRAGGTIQGELAACQRYYYRVSGADASPVATGLAASTTLSAQIVQQKVTMRVAPTAVDYSSISLNDANSGYAATNCVLNTVNTNNTNLTITVASGLTAYRPYNLLLSGASGYLGLSAEL